MILESKTPPPAMNGRLGKKSSQVGKTYSKNNRIIHRNSQHAVRWIASNYHLTLPVAGVIVELAGLGGKR